MRTIICAVILQIISVNHVNDLVYDSYNVDEDVNNENEILRKEFHNYSIKAQKYLDRPVFKGTPLTGEMLAKCAQSVFDSTGILVPYELALSQAQWESGMGLKGLSPCTNPYNVGEYDDMTLLRFSETFEGVYAYYDLIAKDYLAQKEIHELLQNFTNKRGYRYASKPSYEKDIKNTYSFIQRWTKKYSKELEV